MPRFAVKQPNGRFAIFSSVVDDFTITDMTLEDAVSEMGGEDAVRRAVFDDELSCDQPCVAVTEWRHHEGLARWHYCLSEILFRHGWQRLKEVLSTIES